MTYSPTIRRKRLSTALRQLRRDSGQTAEEAARKLGWDPSKISRIENGDWKLPRLADIERLCQIYNAPPKTCEALLALARQSRERGWWEEFKDVLGGALPGLEAEATSIWTYQPLLVPGLLQIPDYTRALCRASMMDDAETERRVQARQARQRILDRERPPLLWAVLDEAALRKLVGGRQLMAAQVAHLLEMSTRENIRLQVLRDEVGAHAAMSGPIVVMMYDSDPTIVYLENAGPADLFLELPEEVRAYTERYSHVMAAASDGPSSREYLQRLMAQLKEGGDDDGSDGGSDLA